MVARMAPGLQISSRFSNSACLTERSSAMASTTRSTSARSSSCVGAGDPAQRRVAVAPRSACRAGLALSSERSIVGADRRRPSRRRGPRTSRRTRPWRRPRRCRWPSCRCRPRRSAAIGADGRAPSPPAIGVCASSTTTGRVRALVGVEAAAGLAAEQAGGDHLLEDRRRRVQPVAALLVHRVEDLVRRVEADQVEQRQRAHRVAAAEPHGGVDVLARGVARSRTSRPRG